MIPSRPGYMQTRSLEAGLALIMIAVGWQLVRSGDTFSAPVYAVVRRWMSEDLGGWLLIAIGTARIAALAVNSHIRSSPLARALGCIIGLSFWSSFAIAVESGAAAMRVSNPILGIVTAALAALELYSCVRTGMDAETLDSLRLQRRARARVRGRERA